MILALFFNRPGKLTFPQINANITEEGKEVGL